MTTGEVCEVAGEVAGTIVRKATKGLEKVKAKTVTICEKVGSVCKKRIARLERKKKDAFTRLGVELWNLYQKKVLKSVFEQNKVKKLIVELEGHEGEIQRIETEMEVKKKMREKRASLRKAKADLKDEDPRVRKAAIRTLYKIGGNTAIPYLNKALDDSDEEIRESAASILQKLVDTSVGMESATGKKVQKKRVKRKRRKRA